MKEQDLQRVFCRLYRLMVGAMVTLVLIMMFGWLAYQNPDFFTRPDRSVAVADKVSQQDFVREGEFIEDEHRLLVIANCTGCHSGKLVTQNRATREGWRNMIRWMQETQNLKDLGADEEKILDYLAKNYAPAAQGRRENLKVEKWYVLE